MEFHWLKYSNRYWAIGVGLEHTFAGYSALRIGFVKWFFSITWRHK